MKTLLRRFRILGDQGIRIWRLGYWEIRKRFPQYPNTPISQSRYPNPLISLISDKQGKINIHKLATLGLITLVLAAASLSLWFHYAESSASYSSVVQTSDDGSLDNPQGALPTGWGGFSATGTPAPVRTNTAVNIVSGHDASVILAAEINGGTGADGSFDPSLGNVVGGCAANKGMTWASPNCTINTAYAGYLGTYNFTTITIPTGTTLTATGTNPLTLYATGNVTITGTINLNGGNAPNVPGSSGSPAGSGGIGVAGGGNGGAGGASTGAGVNGSAGSGTSTGYGYGGAAGGTYTPGNGGGGGYGGAGSNGGNGSQGAVGGAGGSSNNGTAGSGGGGGGGTTGYNQGGAGGGAGGGGITITSNAGINVQGSITANGGNGGQYGYWGTGVGGGGSGGGIILTALTITNTGSITANGGTNIYGYPLKGGNGGGGKISIRGAYYGTGTRVANAGTGGNGTAGAGVVTQTRGVSSGTFESPTVDLIGPATSFGNLSWNAADTTGLVGYWHFDEGSGLTAQDSSGQVPANNGTLSNANAWTTAGKFGNAALNFINTTDVVAMPNPIISGTGDFTIEAWIYSATSGVDRSILGNYGRNPFAWDGAELFINGSNKLYAAVVGTTAATGSTTININTWYHVAATRTSGTVKLYVNGILDGTGSGAASINAVNWAIGNNAALGLSGFSGIIDEARVYSRALSAQEIATHANPVKILLAASNNSTGPFSYYGPNGEPEAPAPAASGIVGLWHLDDGSGSNVTDSSGNGRNGTMFGSNYWTTAGRFSSAFAGNGSSNYWSVADNAAFTPTPNMTVEAWVNPASLPTTNNFYMIIDKADGASSGYGLYLKNNSGTQCIWWAANGYSFTANNTLSINSWSHLVVTQSGATTTIYLNGVQIGTGTSYAITNAARPLLIGKSNYVVSSYLNFPGLIDEVRIYNRVLSQSEILTSYNGGAVYYNYSTGTPVWPGLVNIGNQYLRYKAFLSTANTSITPSLDDLTIGIKPDDPSNCVITTPPLGQRQHQITFQNNAANVSDSDPLSGFNISRSSDNWATTNWTWTVVGGSIGQIQVNDTGANGALNDNTQYWYKVSAYNVGGTSNWATASPSYTLPKAPAVSCDKTAGTAYPAGTTFTFTNSQGWGTGNLDHYKYTWTTSSSDTFANIDANGLTWGSGDLGILPSSDGTWYLHLVSYNGDNVAWNTVVDSSGYIYDSTPPTLPTVTIASNNANTSYAKTGDIVTLNISSDENIQTPTVTIAGHSITPTGSNQTWSAAYTLLSGDTEGAIPFSIDYKDIANNSGATVTTTTNSSNVTFDKTLPTLPTVTIASNNANTSYAKTGDIVTLNISSDENIQTPTVTIAGHSITPTGSNQTWSAAYTLLSGDTEGAIPFSIDYKDIANNSGATVTTTTNSSNVTFDKTLPTLPTVTIASNNANTSYAKTGDIVTLNISSDENIQTPTVTIAGHSITPTGSNQTWSAAYTLLSGDTEGAIPFSIDYKDIANNSGATVTTTTNSSNVTFDNTAPTISLSSPSATYTTGGPITYTITYADTNFNSSTLVAANITLNKTGTANGTVAVSGTGTTRTVTISSITGDGTLGISVAAGTATDSAANQAPAAGPSATFTVDNTAPTISLSSPSATYTTGGPITYTITYADTNFNSSTLVAANITLNKTGTANGTVAVSGTGTTRTVTISSITGDGTLGISVAAGTATDSAANQAPAAGPSATFTVDNTAPTISLSSPSATYTTGGPITYTITYADTNFNSSTLVAANITLNKTGTANGTVAVSGTGTTRTVTISSITGDGTLGISVAAGTATDSAANQAPAAGPSATFTVDNTAPTVSAGSIVAPAQNAYLDGTSTNNTITWSTGAITDANLTSTPITLSYSTDGGSTWTAITNAGNIANTGAFTWTTLPSLNISSATCEIKLRAIDNASNYTELPSSTFYIDSSAPATYANTITAGTDASSAYQYRVAATTLGNNASWTTFGSTGTGDNQFQYPMGISVDTVHNKVYVADEKNFRIDMFDSGEGGTTLGQNWTTFGSQGADTNVGHFGAPFDISVDAVNNRAYVADYNNNRIEIFDSGTGGTTLGQNWTTYGQYGTSTAVGNFYAPLSIFVDSSHNKVYVADLNNRIAMFDSGTLGQNWTTYGGPSDSLFNDPVDIFVDSSHNKVYVTDYRNGRIAIFDSGTDGTILGQNWTTLNANATGLFVDTVNNKIYTSTYYKVSKFDSGAGGTTLGANWQDFGQYPPSGLAADDNGTVGYFGVPGGVFVDTVHNKVFEVDSGDLPDYVYNRVNKFDSGSVDTLYYNSNYAGTGNFTVSCNPEDTVGGILKVNFPSLGVGFSGDGDDASSPYSAAYSWTSSATTSPLLKYTTAYNNSNLFTTAGFDVFNDSTAPAGGSITYTDDLYVAPSVPITLNAGTDAGSGIGTMVLQRADATFANDSDGTFSSWSTISSNPDTTVTKGHSYKYQYVVTDNVNNQSTWTTVNVARLGIRVSSPNGSETWNYSEVFPITWTGVNTISNVKILLSTDGGSTYPNTLISSTPNTGSYNYLVGTMGEDISATSKIRIEDTANSAIYDTSNNNFGIKGKISVTYPATAVEWTMGAAGNITWAFSGGVANVNLRYSTDGGLTYPNVITASTTNTGTYSWTAPLDPSSTMRMRVANAADDTSFGVSNVNFIIKAVKVTAPNGSETWTVGEQHNITWTYAGTIPNVKLEYSSDGGNTYNTITDSTATSNLSYGWTVLGDAVGSQLKIRVSDVNNPTIINDASDNNFSINGVKVLSPNGSETWTVGTGYPVTWTTQGALGNIKLEYSTDAGSTYASTITNSVAASAGSYTWTIPGEAIGSQLKIRASSITTPAIKDASNNNFIINGINLLSPNGSETWTVGTGYPVTWTTQGALGNIKLEYSTDGGSSYTAFVPSVADTGSYTWTVPLQAIGNNLAMVRASSVSDASISNASQSNFTINPVGTFSLTSPNGGETWYSGTSQTITWTNTGTIANVKLLYSIDGGTNYSYTIVDTVANTSSYNWTVPSDATTQAKVKVADVNGFAVEGASSNTFNIAGLRVINPNGAENWTVGTQHNITWTWAGWSTPTLFELDYSTNDGQDNYNNSITAQTNNPAGSYGWTVPDAIGTQVKVKVKKFGTSAPNEVFDISDTSFTIAAPLITNVTVNPPSEETEYFVDDVAGLSWTWVGALKGNIKVSYTPDGTNWTPCSGASALANTATSFNWTIPSDAVSANLTKIKVEDTDSGRSASTGQSSTFTVNAQPAITINSPTGTPNWGVGGSYAISWSASNSGIHNNSVLIEAQTADMAWTTIASAQTASGSLAWTVPSQALASSHSSASGQIRISDATRAASASLADASQSAGFTAVGALTLSTPVNLVVNDNYTVTWTSSGTFTPVRLQLYNGSAWVNMNNTTSPYDYTELANSGSYSWTVPNAVTASARARIYESDYPNDIVSTSSVFNIGTEPTLTITAPTNNPSWRVGSAGNTISWTASTNANDTIVLKYSTNGVTWIQINDSTHQLRNDSITWTVPQGALTASATSGSVQFSIIDAGRAATQMTSAARTAAIIPPAITVGNLSSYVVVGETPSINWTTNGGEGLATYTAAIQYNSASGGNFTTVAGGSSVTANANAASSFNWTAPNDVGTSSIKVYDTYRPNTASATNSNFTICGKFNGVNVSTTQITAGTPLTITWSTTGAIDGSNVKLFYYKDENSDGNIDNTDFNIANVEIDSGTASKTSPYAWTIPTDVAAKYINSDLKIRIRDSRVSTDVNSYKDAATTFRINGSFGVSTPASAGANWTIGVNQPVIFNTTGNISSVDIYYTSDANAGSPTWTLLNTVTPNSNGSTTWTWAVPDNITSQAQIKVADANNSSTSAVSPVFNIVGTLNLTSPVGGENWIIGTQHNITWTTAAGLGSIGTVKLEYSRTNGVTWSAITESYGTADDGIVANTGSFTWTIPNEYLVAGSQVCKVRVTEPNGLSNINDTNVSPTAFIIALPVIQLLQPNGAEQLTLNQTYDNTYNDQVHGANGGGIKWTTTGAVGNLKIEWCPDYTTNQTWATIIATQSNVGVYNSFAPDTITAAGRVRISDAAHPEVTIVSASNFAVLPTPKFTAITHPAATDAWVMGTNQTITWTKEGLVSNNLKLEYSYDNGANYTEIATWTATGTSYSWSVPNSFGVTQDTLAKIRITDVGNSATPIKESDGWTIKIPTITMARPNGGEVWAVGDVAPITWTSQGAVTDNSIQLGYSTDSGSTYTNFITGQANNGSYNWTVLDIQGSNVRLRARDGSRVNSQDTSDNNLTIIASPQIAVTYPVDGSQQVVEFPFSIGWTVRGLSVDHTAIDYWDDTNGNGLLDGTETSQVIVSGVSKGTSDTADAYSGKYSGSYTWTVPDNALATPTLKLRIRGYDANNNLLATAYSAGHFRIKPGFDFRDEGTPTNEFSATTTNWTANSGHSIKWYNIGTSPNVKLQYVTASDAASLGLAISNNTQYWTDNGITIADNLANTPDANNITSYNWTVPDPNINNLPAEPPQYYYVVLRVSSTTDPTISAITGNTPFKIVYNTITWVLKDDETMTLLTTDLGVRSMSGSLAYWNIALGNLSTEGVGFIRRYPQGTFTTIWSKAGYFDTTDSDRSITQDATFNVLMESTTPKEYIVGDSFSYNETTNALMVKTWLQKKGNLVTGDSVNALGASTVDVYYGNTYVGTITLTLDPTTGYYYQQVNNATGAVGTVDANGNPGFGLEAGKTYFGKCVVWYGGPTGTRSSYSAGASFDISVAQDLKAATEQILQQVQGVQANLGGQISTSQQAIQSQITSVTSTIRSDIAGVKTETGQILTATGTESLPTAITNTKTEITNTLNTEIKPQVQSGILNRDTAIKQGSTITISYRTASGKSPTIAVYNSKNVLVVPSGTPMTLASTTGDSSVYNYTFKFMSAWGTGDFTVVCSESTQGTVDALILTVYTTDIQEVAGQVAAVLGSTSNISGLKSVADTLNSQFSLVDQALSKLSQGLAGKPEQIAGVMGQVDSVYKQLTDISTQIDKLSGAGGVNLKKLYEVSKEKKDDMVYLKNKTEELKAAMEINNKMTESVAKKPVVQTWFEFK